ncbi:MAG: phage holin family protein [Actinomycetota bacterium]
MNPGPKEIPELVSELAGMSKEYLRQETLEPARRLGKHAAFGIGGAVAFSLASIFLTFGLFTYLRRVLPDTEWWSVAARLFTFLGAGAGAALIGWRMTRDDHPR